MDQLTKNNSEEYLMIFKSQSAGYSDQKKKFWMPRFDDQVIRTPQMLQTKLEYIHNNPVVAGLAPTQEAYKYSSARNYNLGDHSIIEVNTEWW